MKQFFQTIGGSILLAAVFFLTGCRTADLAHSGQTASLKISGHSEVDILRAMQAVFLADGYEHMQDLVFEKKGSAWDTAAYGDWGMSSIWIRIKASVDADPNGGYIIGCNAYLVSDRGQGVLENEQKSSYAERSECKKILAEIKARLASGTPETDA